MDNADPAHTPPSSPAVAPPAKRAPSGWGKLWAAFGLGVASYIVLFAIQFAGAFAGYATGDGINTVVTVSEACASIVAILCIVALGGKRIAKPSFKGMGTAFKAAAWLFIADGMLISVELVQLATGADTIEIASDWPIRVGLLALMCFAIGMAEETTMRGLCLNGLLARMGRTRGGVYGAVILSSLIFGLLHFDPLIDFTSGIEIAQNCMKVLQTGMCGFLFAAILVKTRNIWTVVVIHSLDDFVLLFITNGLAGTPLATDYVQTGDTGIAILLVYCITCAIYLPFIFIGKRLIDEVGPWRGDFYHYGEADQTASAPVATAVAPLPGNIPVAEPVYPAHSQNIYQAPYPPANPGEREDTAADEAATAKALRGKHAAPSRTEHTEGINHGQGV
ncbi:MAG: type II CAAX endopeptidase family protein [Coriobacteriia bacterium]|nr:type II CAAX endopeptidase family protein [Coriobacteriia bacterium]